MYQDGVMSESKGPLIGRGSAARLEAAGGDEPRALTGERSLMRPPPGRSPRDRPWSRLAEQTPGVRRALGVALIAVLATAWVLVGRSEPDGLPTAVPTSQSPPRARAGPAARVEAVTTVPHWVPDAIASTCRARRKHPSNVVVVVDCTPGRGVIALQYRSFHTVAAVRAAYGALAPRRGGDGPSRCSRGAAEERSWSVSDAPTLATGRYRCSVVAGRARLVWSSEHAGAPVVAFASRADAQYWTEAPSGACTSGVCHSCFIRSGYWYADLAA